ncbi:MAG: oligosaccharide flippase family protein [Bacteroidaceae bacterium]
MQKNWKRLNSGSTRSALIKKNIAGAFGLKAINIAVSFILVPLTIGYVSSQTYGVWMTLSSVLLMIGFFDIGFSNGLRNRVAENASLGNIEKCQQYISTTYFCLTAIFLPLGLIALWLCRFVDWVALLNISPKMSEEVLQTIQVVVLFTSIHFIVKTISVILTALQYNAYGALIDTIGNILVFVVIVVLKFLVPGSLLILALALTCIPLIVYILSSIYVFSGKYATYRPKVSCIRLPLVKDIMNLGIQFFIIQIAVLVLYGAMNVLISHVSNPEYVTEYNVVYKYIGIPLMIFNIIITPFWSAYTDAYTRKDYAWMRSLYSKLIKIVLLSFAGVVLLVCFYPLFFKLWLGEKVSIHLSMILVVALYVMTNIWNTLHSYIINGIGCISIQLYVSLIGTVLNIPFALFFGKMYGAEGVIISVSIYNLLPAVIHCIQVRRVLNQTAKGIWIK